MSVEWEQIVVDASQPVALGRWWADALGWVTVDGDGDSDELEIRPALDTFPGLLFVLVPEPKITKNRLHVDLRPDNQSAEVDRLLALGARHVDVGQGEHPWVVLADPEGNEFCVLGPRSDGSTGSAVTTAAKPTDSPSLQPGVPPGIPIAVGVQAAYDVVARAYDAQLGDELDHKPLDRGVLDAFRELAGPGMIADVGCGPGHVTRYLAARGAEVIGIDLSPEMINVAREHAPSQRFEVGSMLALAAPDDAWSGAIALYSIIHLSADERAIAFAELSRVVRPGGCLLIAFHVDSPEFAAGEVNHLKTWFGEHVELDGFFLDPGEVAQAVEAAGFAIMSTTIRQPQPEVEYPSRRCYLLAKRR